MNFTVEVDLCMIRPPKPEGDITSRWMIMADTPAEACALAAQCAMVVWKAEMPVNINIISWE